MFYSTVMSVAVPDPAQMSLDDARGELADLSKLDSVVAARRYALLQRIDELSAASPMLPDAGQVLGEVTATSTVQASRQHRHARPLGDLPVVHEALKAARLGDAHVTVLARGVAGLEPDERARFVGLDARLAGAAEGRSPEAYARWVREQVNMLRTSSGLERLARQRRATRLRSWTGDDGMVNLHAVFDPERGLLVLNRLRAVAESMFHDTVPPDCPSGETKHEHLRALALAHLIGGSQPQAGDTFDDVGLALTDGLTPGANRSRVDVSIILDYQTLCDGIHQRTHLDCGGGVELPVETIRRLACDANLIPMVFNTDGVPVDVGRSRRLATPDQRRLLRAMYPTCAVPDCPVTNVNCQPHHIQWWRHHGPTNIDNLIPLCSRHHHHVHEGGWQLHLHPTTRTLTITRPGSTTLQARPATAHAA